MQDFSVEGVHKMFGGGPIFRGWNEIFSIGKSPEFGVIFQKYALKLGKLLSKFEKNANFSGDF